MAIKDMQERYRELREHADANTPEGPLEDAPVEELLRFAKLDDTPDNREYIERKRNLLQAMRRSA